MPARMSEVSASLAASRNPAARSRTVRECSGWKPRWSFCMCQSVSNSSAAPESRITDSAISTATRARRMSRCPPAAPPRPACCKTDCRSMRPARKAGRPPKSNAVASETSRAMPKTRKSTLTSLNRGSSPAAKWTKPRRAASTKIMPASGARGDQQRDFGEQLARQASASGADRRPHRQLASARRPARQQEVGDVGAGDGEQARGRAHQDRAAACGHCPRDAPGAAAAPAYRRGTFAGKSALLAAKSISTIGPRLRHRDAALEPSEDRPGRHAAVAMAGGRRNGQRGEQVDLDVRRDRRTTAAESRRRCTAVRPARWRNRQCRGAP